jgi:predicted acetyltransferase
VTPGDGNSVAINRFRTYNDGMGDLDLRPFPVDDFTAALRLLHIAFGGEAAGPEHPEFELALFDPDRSLGAYIDGAMVGTTWVQPLRMVTPGGGAARVAGVTGVGVSPVHRRRGVLSVMMARQLADIHTRREESVAALWASEPSIYGRFGYGLAVPLATVYGERAHLRFSRPRRDDGMRLRLTDAPDAAELEPVRRVAPRPGMILRDAVGWSSRLADPPGARDGASELLAVVADGPGGGPEGYVLYRTASRRDVTGPGGMVRILELAASTARARDALWRYVADLDLTAGFEYRGLPVDDPLFHLVTDPRRLSFTLRDGLFFRLVDMPRALTERSYRATSAATLEVVDDVCPWNAGRWRLDISPGGASCERTRAPADITLSARELGAAYLGGPALRTLALAGLIDEHTPGALGSLSDAFVGELAPQADEVF